ncbi:uncharacterized protein B0T23DRAFT_408552 [Neurospora hispaniola]|uniref:Uncharacterized protein n=1 Tax=Neurospora hispaniola TaxID=588809 RepID=A0AAJ0MM67_9PEZI|nr:hypothetical protein B0T23DRAFT_408552 [Neurospora hispaniola]
MAILMRIYTPKVRSERIGGKKQASRHKSPRTLAIHIHFGTDTCENFLTVGQPVARAKPFRNRISDRHSLFGRAEQGYLCELTILPFTLSWTWTTKVHKYRYISITRARLAYIASLNSMQTPLAVPSSSCCHLRSQLTSLAFG